MMHVIHIGELLRNFCGCPTQLFNAGNLRRESGKSGVKANFFDNSNADAKRWGWQLETF